MSSHVELRIDPNITTAGPDAATPEDARKLHDWPDEMPDADEPVKWAVMDSGIHQDLVDNHPWFDNATVGRRYDATGEGTGGDQVGHGSGVASIIAKNTPKIELWSVRIFGDSGRTDFQTIADAYRWLIDHGDELDGANLSWGARQDVPAINELHEQLLSKGVHDCVAAGNTGDDGGSPATSLKAFSAGAVDEKGRLTRFTSYDPDQDNPDVVAVGKDVLMARAPGTSMGYPISDDMTKASGTSFSAPYTSAAYINALYKARRSWDRAFEQAAPDIPGSKADGEGLLKLKPALKETAPEEPNPTTQATMLNFLGTDAVLLDADWLPTGVTTAELTDESKKGVDIRFKK